MVTNNKDKQSTAVEEQVDEEFEFRPDKLKRVPTDQRHIVTPEDVLPKNTKVRITMYVDQDIFDFFKAKASVVGAYPYQTQINRVLRLAMEGGEYPPANFLIEKCAWCEAKGRIWSSGDICQCCNGHGYVAVLQPSTKCVPCGGTGSNKQTLPSHTECTFCGGTGWFWAKKKAL